MAIREFDGELDAAPMVREFTGDLDPVEDSQLSAQPSQGFSLGNVARGAGERAADLAGNVAGFAATTGSNLERDMPLGGFVWEQGDFLPSYKSGEEYAKWKEANPDKEALRNVQESLKAASFGYKPGTTWEEVKQTDGFFPVAGKLAAFGLETGLVSIPDMVGAAANAPVYITSRTEEIAQERAKNDGRDTPDATDVGVGATTATIVAAMEKFGAEKVLSAFINGGSAARNILKAAVGEGGTEFLQEQVEYAGETADTKTGWDAGQSFERGLQGLVGGVTTGGAIATAAAPINAHVQNKRAEQIRNVIDKTDLSKWTDDELGKLDAATRDLGDRVDSTTKGKIANEVQRRADPVGAAIQDAESVVNGEPEAPSYPAFESEEFPIETHEPVIDRESPAPYWDEYESAFEAPDRFESSEYHPEANTYGRTIYDLARQLEDLEPALAETIIGRGEAAGLSEYDTIQELQGAIRERTPFATRYRPRTTPQGQGDGTQAQAQGRERSAVSSQTPAAQEVAPVQRPASAPVPAADVAQARQTFAPTHELSDGTRVRATAEPNVWEDAQGNEYEDNYAAPLRTPPDEPQPATPQAASQPTFTVTENKGAVTVHGDPEAIRAKLQAAGITTKGAPGKKGLYFGKSASEAVKRALQGGVAQPQAQPVSGEVPPTTERPQAAEQPATKERRVSGKARALYEAMSKDELVRALLHHELTGIKGKRAFVVEVEDAESVISIDADSLKWVNDNMSPDSGDMLLQVTAQALKEEFGYDRAYHTSGDEFYVLLGPGESLDDAKQMMDKVEARVKAAHIDLTMKDGTYKSVTGITATPGYGKTKEEADYALKAEKRAREAAGVRAGRGEQPAGAVVRPAPGGMQSDEGNASAAGAPDVRGEVSSEEVTPAKEPQQTPADAGVSASTSKESVAEPDEASAAAILSSANVTGKDRLDIMSKFRAGEYSLKDLEDAYPAQDVQGKETPATLTSEPAKGSETTRSERKTEDPITIISNIAEADPFAKYETLRDKAMERVKEQTSKSWLDHEESRGNFLSDSLAEAIHEGRERGIRRYAETLPVTINQDAIPEHAATSAFSGTSHSPEKRGASVRRDYVYSLVDLWRKHEAAYNAAAEDRKAQFVEVFNETARKYASLINTYLSAHGRVMSSMIVGPARFPVESNRKKIGTADRRAQEASEYIGKASRRLAKILRGSVDNSLASQIVEAEARLADRERDQERMKAVNAAMRKGNDDVLRGMGLDDAEIARLKKPDFAGRTGYPDYALKNNNAEIRRLRDRVEDLKRRAQAAEESADAADQPTTEGVRIVRNAELGRLQLFFDDKPPDVVRNELKGAAFKWAPSTGAWQRQLTDNAVMAANRIIAKHYPSETKETDKGGAMFASETGYSTKEGLSRESAISTFRRQFPTLATTLDKLIARGDKGQKGGLIMIESLEEAQRTLAEKTGREQFTEIGNGEGILGLYDPQSGMVAAILPNLDAQTFPGVVFHEFYHASNMDAVNRRAVQMVRGGAAVPVKTREFLARVQERIDDVQATLDAREYPAYIIQTAVEEGRQAGFSAVDGKFMDWVDATLGKGVGNLIRDFVANVRVYLLKRGVAVKADNLTIDDMVALAKAGMREAARGETAARGNGMLRSVSDKQGSGDNLTGQTPLQPESEASVIDSKEVDDLSLALNRLDAIQPRKGHVRLYRSSNSPSGGDVSPWTSWTPETETAEAYTENQGFGGRYVEALDVPEGETLDLTGQRDPFRTLANALGYEDPMEVADEWRGNGWNYPWEESGTVKRKLESSGYDFLRYEDDFPSGAIAVVPLRSTKGLPPVNPNQPQRTQGAGDEALINFARAPSVARAATKAGEVLADALNRPGTFGPLARSLQTQYHKATKSPEFRAVWNRAHAMFMESARAMSRPASLAPSILPKFDAANFRDAAKALFTGKWHTPLKDIAAASKALNAGTLVGGASPLSGKVFTPEELRNGIDVGGETLTLTDAQIRLYLEGRAAIDASLTETAAAEAWSIVKRYTNDAGLRQAIAENPQDAEGALTQLLTAAKTDEADRLNEMAKSAPKEAQTILADELTPEERAEELKTLAKKRESLKPVADQAAIVADLADSLKRVKAVFAKSKALQKAGYMPLMRFGKYRVSVVIPDAEGGADVEYVSRYESVYEANRARRKLLEEFPPPGSGYVVSDVEPMNDEKWRMFKGVNPETVMLFAEASGIQADEVMQSWYKEAVGNRSSLRRLIHRKGYEGYSEDLPRVLASFITSNGKRAGYAYHLGDMTRLVNQDLPGDVQAESQKLLEAITNQERGMNVRGLMATWYLLGSAASSIVNMTQTVTMSLPWLSQYGKGFSPGQASKALASAYTQIVKGAREDTQQALKRAEQDGIVDSNEVYHLYAEAMKPMIAKLGSGNLAYRARAFMTLWGTPFAIAEKLNRKATFIAAYQMALANGRNSVAAFEFAEKAVIETQGIYSQYNRPNWARGPVGGAVLTFKQYSIAYIEMLARMAKNGPEGKKAALLSLAILFFFGGLAGLPGEDDLLDIIDTFAQAFFGKAVLSKLEIRNALHDALGKEMGEFVNSGVSAYLPLDISGRMGMGNLLPGTALLKPSEPNKAQEAMEAFGVAGSFARSLIDGANAMMEGEFARAARTAAPKAIGDILKGAEMAATGEARDMRGRKIVDADAVDAVMQMIGFNPSSKAEVQRSSYAVQELISYYKRVESDIVADWARGAVDHDREKIAEARKRLAQWNKNNPDMPIRITSRQILARAKQLRMEREGRLLKMAPREIRREVRELSE